MGDDSAAQDGQVFKVAPAGYHVVGFAIDKGLTSKELRRTGSTRDAAIEDAFTAEVIRARTAPYAVTASTCTGSGVDESHPIGLGDLASPKDQVRAGIACSLPHFPHPVWNGAQLVAKGDHYLMVVTSLDKSMKLVEVFTDVSQFAATVTP